MTDTYITPEVQARIGRVETGVTRDAPLWSQDTEQVSILDRMAYYTTPGLSIAVINNGELEWARTRTQTPYGPVRSDWRTRGRTLELRVDVPVGSVNIVAIGVDAQGDAVMSNAIGAVTVTTVP